MSYGTYRNTDHPNPTGRKCCPRRDLKQRERAQREAAEAERVKQVIARWDRMLGGEKDVTE